MDRRKIFRRHLLLLLLLLANYTQTATLRPAVVSTDKRNKEKIWGCGRYQPSAGTRLERAAAGPSKQHASIRFIKRESGLLWGRFRRSRLYLNVATDTTPQAPKW